MLIECHVHNLKKFAINLQILERKFAINLTCLLTLMQIERRKEETNQRLEGLHEQYRELGITYDWGDVRRYDDI